MPYLDEIWYVSGAGAEGAHTEFWARHMLISVSNLHNLFKNWNSFCLEHISGTVCPTFLIFDD